MVATAVLETNIERDLDGTEVTGEFINKNIVEE